MKFLDPGFQARLNGAATTLCWCWKLERADGVRLGFTDHDRNLAFDGVIFEAGCGFTASEVRDSLGLSVDNLEVDGALSSEALDEADLTAGVYDDARIEIWRVNWNDVSQRALMRKGSLGEVRRGPMGFTAEARGLAHYLNQENGRLYQFACDAELGDRRCKVDLGAAGNWSATGTVGRVRAPWRFDASGLEAFAPGHFDGGLLTWTSGTHCGRQFEVKGHERSEDYMTTGLASLELWRGAEPPMGPCDSFVITAGCDKIFSTCCDRFCNAINFRGFPHLPGNDFILGGGRKT